MSEPSADHPTAPPAIEPVTRDWQSGIAASPTVLDTLPRPQLLALLRADQRRRWLRGQRVRVEDYRDGIPRLGDDPDALLDLIDNEHLLREERNEPAGLEEYQRRFPALADALARQFALHRAVAGSVLELLAAGPPPPATAAVTLPPPGPRADAATLAPAGPGGDATLSATADAALPAAPVEVHIPGYEVLGELGRGGMGVVYQARQVGLNRVVALKMILAGGHAGEAERARFRLEAEAVARLQHPNIVQIYEVGEVQGRSYFSLEFVGGGTLASRLNRQPQPPRPAAQLVAVLARAVHAAHQAGIVHRDLKPGNVLLQNPEDRGQWTEDSQASALSSVLCPLSSCFPKITDFGLAKRLDAEAGLTQSNAILGTPSYMAPEQAESKTRAIGPPADIYALGAILYECLTGRPPFLADTPIDTILQVVSDNPAPPSRLQSRVPGELEAVCLKCLAKDPRQRYPSAAALAEDLERYLEGQPTDAARGGPQSWVRQHAWQLAAAGVWLLGLLAIIGVATVIKGPALAMFIGTLGGVSWRAGQLLWRRGAARGLDILRGHEGQVYAVAFHPGGKQLASAGADRAVRVWDVTTGQVWATLAGQHRKVYAVAYSPDGQTLASAGNNRSVALWDAQAGKLRAALKLPHRRAYALAFSPDGRTLAVGTPAGTVDLWDPATQQPLGTLRRDQGRAKAVYALAFSPDGRLLAAGHANGTHTLWDVAGRPERAVLQRKGPWRVFLRTGHSPALAFAPDGRLLVTGRTEKGGGEPIHLWNGVTGQYLGSLRDRKESVGLRDMLDALRDSWHGYRAVSGLAFSPDGKQLAAAYGREVRLWEAGTGRVLHRFTGHTRKVLSVAFAPDGQVLASGGADKTVRLWDPYAPPRPRPRSWWQRLLSR